MSTILTYKDAISDIKDVLESQASVLDKEISECEKYVDLSSIVEKRYYRLLGMQEAIKQIKEILEFKMLKNCERRDEHEYPTCVAEKAHKQNKKEPEFCASPQCAYCR